MDTISPSSSSSSTHQWKYHVFLSFRGKDTRNNFTGHLYAALNQKGVYTFKDDEKLVKGEPISPVLLEAIEDSLFAIVVLSKDYASSTWCLDELVKIMDCRKNMGLIVLPIFYDVEPSVVRKQTESYAQAFAEHEKPFNKNSKKVHTWRAALTDVSNLAGWSLEDRPEFEFIQEIVKEISLKLSSLLPKDTSDFVGIDSRVEKLMSLLAVGSGDDVRIVGIWGMGGIGKTTLARIVYNAVFKEFQCGCFVGNVRSESKNSKLVTLQKKLIREILMEESVYIRDECDGVCMIKSRLRFKKVLLVLDDVDQFNQLEMLAGDSNWFGSGSRVIITTRDQDLLRKRDVHVIYEAQGLNDIEALRLFSLKAFKEHNPPRDYLDFSTSFVDYAKGVPLAISVLGSFLYKRSKEEWEAALNRLKEYPKKKIIDILEIGFDGLEGIDQEIFLYIACFFNKGQKNYIVKILGYLGLHPESGLNVLIDKSLLKYDENTYWMHDLLQQMGQDMVRRGCPHEPEKWSKLWQYKDIRIAFMKNMEMEAIQGLVLQLGELDKSKKEQWNLETFPKMPKLKLLIIRDVQLLPGPEHLSNSLRYLDWSEYPSKSLPLNFQPVELVELHLLHSELEWLWKGTKYLDNLKLIKLNNSLSLIATPDFSGVPNLEKLVFSGCVRLHEVHPSIMVLKRLTLLDLGNCKSLRNLPGKFEMKSLEVLILSGCPKIKRIPEFMGNMKRLAKLHLAETAITKLPSSIEHLTNLDTLDLRHCRNLVCLPSNICRLESLRELSLQGCKGPPPNIWNKLFPMDLMPRRSINQVSLLLPSLLDMHFLKRLDLRDCNLQEIPSDIGNLSFITKLTLSENPFSCLPESMVQLSKLECVILKDCTRLRSLPKLPSMISVIEANGCTSLETFPNEFKLPGFRRRLYFVNCYKLVGPSDMSNVLQLLLPVHKEFGEVDLLQSFRSGFHIGIPGSEIPEWFTHQSVGYEVSLRVTHQYEYKKIGIVACFVLGQGCNFWGSVKWDFEPSKYIRLFMPVGHREDYVMMKSDHLLMVCIPFERAKLGQIDENEFRNMNLWCSLSGGWVKKCGFRVVCEQDIEDIREMILAQSNNSSCITPNEGLDVHHNSTEGIKLKRSCDEYEGAGASGEPYIYHLLVLTQVNHIYSTCLFYFKFVIFFVFVFVVYTKFLY